MNKKTVLFIGEGIQCSLETGMAWHLNIPGHTLVELLERKYNLLKGAPDEWSVRSGKLYYRDKPLKDEMLKKLVCGAFFYHKNQPNKQVDNLQKIYSFLQNSAPHIQLLNNPHESKLFSSKIEFSQHVAQLPNAKSLLPKWSTFEKEADLDQAIDTIGFPLLIKPDSLSSGKGIVKVEDKAYALKILSDSKNGIYHKKNISKLKQFLKNIASPKTKMSNKNEPVKLLINEFIDTYHHELKCYINANIYYWMGELFYADARVSHKGFNIHAGDQTNKTLTTQQYKMIISEVFNLIKKESNNIKEMIKSLNQHLIRVDCLINLKERTLNVAELEIKGGPGQTSRKKIIPLMKKAEWDENKILDYLDGKPCDINALFT